MIEQTKQKVRQFILENLAMGESAEIADDASFTDRHIIDSTGFLELISFLEDTFAIEVKDEEMVPENLDSLNSIEQYVARKVAVVPADGK